VDIIEDRVDNLGGSCFRNQQRIRFVKPDNTLPEVE
jgi:hypothetical protein